jgi:putative oxidoreductase
MRYWSEPDVPAAEPPEERRRMPTGSRRWPLTGDLGLLVLRLALGAVFFGHGMQKLFGVFGGPGLSGFAGYLTAQGYRHVGLLAGVTAVTELLGGTLVLLGLLTPLAAAGLLGVMISAIWQSWDGGFFLGPGGGIEYEFTLAGLAAGLVLTGGGRLAVDRALPLFHRPQVTAVPCLLIGVGSALAVHALLYG